MALTPLPVENITSHKAKQASPYPVFGEPAGSSGETITSTPAVIEAERLQRMEEMLQEAQGRAENMEREAYDKAYAMGEKAGLALGEKRAEQILESMQTCLNQTEMNMQQLEKSSVDAVVDIAQSITEFLIGEMLAENSDVLFKAAQRAAEQLPNIENLRLVVHPDDMDLFKRLIQEREPNWLVHADSKIAVGSCRLMSNHEDALVDPVQAITDAVQHIRGDLYGDGLKQTASDVT